MRHDFILPVPSQRFVIVHFHIFKNAGSTLESIFEREFPGQFATVHGPLPESSLTARDLVKFVRENPTVRAVSSHHLHYPLPAIPEVVFFDCCFLRHPLTRLHSVYSHLRRGGDEDLLFDMAQQQSPNDFLRNLIDGAPHLISNVQVAQLANAGEFRRPSDRRDLNRAAKMVRDMAIPGVVEIFDESLTVAEYFLKPAFPEISLPYIRQNVTDAGESRAPVSVDALRKWWGRKLFEELSQMNELDLELIRIATDEVRRRSLLVPGFSGRLADLRSRCETVQAVEEGPLAESADQRGMIKAG